MDLLDRNAAKRAETVRRLMADSLDQRAEELLRTAERWRRQYRSTAAQGDLSIALDFLGSAAASLKGAARKLRENTEDLPEGGP